MINQKPSFSEFDSSVGYYQKHLDGVSRSFAFCIKELDQPIRYYISHAYLVFRVLDTIEDHKWEYSSQQDRAFEVFHNLIEGTDFERNYKEFNSICEPINNPAEKALINDSRKMWTDLHKQPSECKALLKKHVDIMQNGMRYYLKKSQSQGNQLLQKISGQDLNQYCFFVAGTVGKYLSDIVSYFYPQSSQSLDEESMHFGLFLQKVNVLKDFIEDKVAGRSFVTDWNSVFLSLKKHSQSAFTYIQSIPKSNGGYKLFCMWSFFLGLESLPYIEKSYKQGTMSKISRVKTMLMVQKIKSIVNSPEKIESLYLEKMKSFKNYDSKNSKPYGFDEKRFNTFKSLSEALASFSPAHFRSLEL